MTTELVNSQSNRRRARAGADNAYLQRAFWTPPAFRASARAHGFRVAETSELPGAHALAEDIMEMQLAPLTSLAASHEKTKATAWVCDAAQGTAALTGIFLLLPLTWDGEAALRMGRLDFFGPDVRHLCAPGEEMASLYLWLCAGWDADARRNIMRTADAWFTGPCQHLRVYGRAASEEGIRAFNAFGFRRLSADHPDLFLLDQ